MLVCAQPIAVPLQGGALRDTSLMMMIMAIADRVKQSEEPTSGSAKITAHDIAPSMASGYKRRLTATMWGAGWMIDSHLRIVSKSLTDGALGLRGVSTL